MSKKNKNKVETVKDDTEAVIDTPVKTPTAEELAEADEFAESPVEMEELDVEAANALAEKLENNPDEFQEENPRDKIFVGFDVITGEKVYV